ncbi:MAG: hypothetical protein SPJ27_02535 [Candidatus Onthovivens sp.]|nr:hypothetical protein [Candidatus Onthovivens sp.]
MNELLKQIGIDAEPVKAEDGNYNIDIEDSNEYGKYFSKLDKSDLVEEDQDASSVNFENSSIQFVNDEYTLTLIADFENDTYSLSIREN